MIFISIDWDFFIKLPRPNAMLKLPNGARLPAALLMDWGANDRMPHGLCDALWLARSADILANGFDLREFMPRQVVLGDFYCALRRRYDWGRCLHASDSHAQASRLCQDADEIVHFDAHHDMGYSHAQLVGEVHSGNWLHREWRRGADVTLVYPDWRGLGEWRERKMPMSTRGARRAKATTWSKWSASATTGQTRAVAFLCRSPAWTHPQWDVEFRRLESMLGQNHVECMDCADGVCRGRCVMRRWDPKAAETLVEARSGLVCRA